MRGWTRTVLAAACLFTAACATAPPPKTAPPEVQTPVASPSPPPHDLQFRQVLTVDPETCPPPPADPEAAARAAALYQQACDGGDANGCVRAAGAAVCARGAGYDPPRALRDLDAACARNVHAACTSAGLVRLKGQFGLDKDVVRGAALLARACDGGDVGGCVALAWCYHAGLGVAVDQAAAERLSLSACEKSDNMIACSNFGLFAIDARDGPRALKYAGRACDRGYLPACANLSLVYLQGIGVAEDDAKAAAYARRACDGGNAPACVNLGTFYVKGIGVPRDVARGMKLLLDACDGGNFAACDNGGLVYRDGAGMARDLGKARQLFRRACDGGFSSACSHLANMVGATPDT